MTTYDPTLGARVVDGGARFRVWAPRQREVSVKVNAQQHVLAAAGGGMFETYVRGVTAGDDYTYVIGGRERPDPVSRWQPGGVHGPSRVVDPSRFTWTDQEWRGLPLEQYLVYELHVGTFTTEGTFAAAIARLPHLVALGVTAVELMPVAEFPGTRNWGYDGVHMFAPQSTYGGPDGLRMFVDACHAAGLAVILDVVYNHVGPEGNYLAEFGPYFTDRYRTPWGPAINYDDADSDHVRGHVITNAAYWIGEYHIDGLRLDAIHGIFDFSARHVLAELADAARAAGCGRDVHVIAESDLNDVRVIRDVDRGGYRLDAQWSDDLHHALRTVLTSDRRGYFEDFGRVDQLAKALTDGFVYDGTYSTHRRRRHGSSSASEPGKRLVVYSQNHDQIANGSQGRRLTELVGHRAHKLAAALVLVAPNVPMLFMGEEYAELAPFTYFIEHGDPALVEAVREGRRRELGALDGELVDPQAEATFRACTLDWSLLEQDRHAEMLRWYRALIALRRSVPCLANCRSDLAATWANNAERWLVLERRGPAHERSALVVCNFGDAARTITCAGPTGTYELALSSEASDTDTSGPIELATPWTLELPPQTARIYLSTHPARERSA